MSQRPSDLVCIADRWVALQFDNAVTFTGRAIESALLEREKKGSGKNIEYERKYSLSQLLRPGFRLPLAGNDAPADADSGMRAFTKAFGVKVERINN